MYLLHLTVSVHHDDALGVALGDLVVAAGDRALELDSLLLEAVGLAFTPHCIIGVDPEQDRELGHNVARRHAADLVGALHAQPPCRALVGDRGVREAVRDHVPAGLEGARRAGRAGGPGR